MKKHLLLLLAPALLLMAMVPAEICDSELFVKGTEVTMTSYNSKGAIASVALNTITEVTRTATSVTALGHVVTKDEKGKEFGSADMKVRCENGKIYMDIKRFATPQATAAAARDMTLDFEGQDMEYPTVMTVGSTLPEGLLTMTTKSSGSVVSVTKVRMYDRKVLAKESRTTPAGTFDCYKIGYNIEINMAMGTVQIPVQTRRSVEWFSARIGTIRTESYKGENMESYSEMTKIKKP